MSSETDLKVKTPIGKKIATFLFLLLVVTNIIALLPVIDRFYFDAPKADLGFVIISIPNLLFVTVPGAALCSLLGCWARCWFAFIGPLASGFYGFYLLLPEAMQLF